MPSELRRRAGTAAKQVAGALGYDLRRRSSAQADDAATRAAEAVRHHTMLPPERLVALYRLAAFCETAPVSGAYVQCGVWKGGAAALLAAANRDAGTPPRPLHLFDSFGEACFPDERVDGQRAVREAREWATVTGPLDGRLEPLTGVYRHLGGPGTEADVRAAVNGIAGHDPALTHVHVGWFQDTVPAAVGSIGAIALLHLDADFYAGTRLCLEHLWPLVAHGGFVVFDDYGTYEGCRLAVDEFLGAIAPAHYLQAMDADSSYVIKLVP